MAVRSTPLEEATSHDGHHAITAIELDATRTVCRERDCQLSRGACESFHCGTNLIANLFCILFPNQQRYAFIALSGHRTEMGILIGPERWPPSIVVVGEPRVHLKNPGAFDQKPRCIGKNSGSK